MEGRWEQESFLLPLPDADKEFLANFVGDEEASNGDGENNDDQEDVKLPSLLGPAAERTSDEDGNATAGGESNSASIDDGVHLRVEVWQGNYCHGQVRGAVRLRARTAGMHRRVFPSLVRR